MTVLFFWYRYGSFVLTKSMCYFILSPNNMLSIAVSAAPVPVSGAAPMLNVACAVASHGPMRLNEKETR